MLQFIEKNAGRNCRALLSHSENQTPHSGRAGAVLPFRNPSGISYYLNLMSEGYPDLWEEITDSRKTIIEGDYAAYEGELFRLNNKTGLHTRIIHRCIRELNTGLKLWARVFAFRFDLHHRGVKTKDSKMVSKFLTNCGGAMSWIRWGMYG